MSPDAALLTRGKKTNVALGAAAFDNTVVQCQGDDILVVEAKLTAGALGDLEVLVQPFEADNATILTGINIAPTRSSGPILSGGRSRFYAEYDVAGIEQVNISVQNKNAGAQTLETFSWRLA